MTSRTEIFFSHLFNISRHEWGRVLAAWCVKFFIQIATVLGFILMTVFFVTQHGIEQLPVLFIFQSLFIVIGTLLFADILKSVSKKRLFLIGALSGGVLLVGSALMKDTTTYSFWLLLLLTYSVLLAQMNILLTLFIEELFTPLESERTFPVIESAEPIGTLLAGVIAAGGVFFLEFHAHDLLWIWATVMVILIPVFFLLDKKLEPVPIPRSRKHLRQKFSKREEIRQMWSHVNNIPFLKGLLIVVFLHWFAFHLVEFQFTKAVELEFVRHDAISRSDSDYGVAEALTHGLGRLNIFIAILFLLSQLLLASRVMKRFGLMRTILLHPITSLLASFTMFLKFSFLSSVSTKTLFEVLGGLKRNAYHASFYALRPQVREQAKEFLEGIARPGGMMLGTLVLLLLQNTAPQEMHNTVISVTLVILFGFMLLQAFRLSKHYTYLARKNLETHGNAPEKMDAIEILAQKGHQNSTQHLVKSLAFRKEKPEVQIKILKTLGNLCDPLAIPEILKFLQHEARPVRIAAVRAISQYRYLAESPLTQSFSQYRVVETLQELFVETNSKEIKLAIIEVFRNINHKDIVPFLLQALDTPDPELKADVIYVCGLFPDVSTAYYLQRFLDMPHPRVKSNAIIALWKFVPYRLKLLMRLNAMLQSDQREELLSAIYAAGETRMIQETPRLQKLCRHEDPDIRKHAAIALVKLGEKQAIESVVEFLLSPDIEISKKTRNLLKSLDFEMHTAIRKSLTQRISKQILEILEHTETEVLEEMEEAILLHLLHAYEILEEEREAMEIREILEERKIRTKEGETGSLDRPPSTPSGGRVSLESLL